MLPLRVVEQLDVLKHVLPSGVACWIGPPSDAFAFQELEEAFGDGAVVTIATPTHAGFEVVLAEKRLPFAAGELGTLIGMHHDLSIGHSTPDGH